MSEIASSPVSPLFQALGRVPSGLYILTVRHGPRTTGMLASWVQQAGFAPPMITVAVGTGRYVGDWIASSASFTLNQVPAGNKALLRHFGRGFAADAQAFEGLDLLTDGPFGPVLASALAFLHAEVSGEIASGDHRIFLGRIVEGGVIEATGEPMLHTRRNGSHY